MEVLSPGSYLGHLFMRRPLPGLQPAHSSLMNASKLSLNLELFQITADCVMLGCEEKDTLNLTKTIFGLPSLAFMISLDKL